MGRLQLNFAKFWLDFLPKILVRLRSNFRHSLSVLPPISKYLETLEKSSASLRSLTRFSVFSNRRKNFNSCLKYCFKVKNSSKAPKIYAFHPPTRGALNSCTSNAIMKTKFFSFALIPSRNTWILQPAYQLARINGHCCIWAGRLCLKNRSDQNSSFFNI